MLRLKAPEGDVVLLDWVVKRVVDALAESPVDIEVTFGRDEGEVEPPLN